MVNHHDNYHYDHHYPMNCSTDFLFSSGRDNVINIWDLSNRKLLKTIPSFEVWFQERLSFVIVVFVTQFVIFF